MSDSKNKKQVVLIRPYQTNDDSIVGYWNEEAGGWQLADGDFYHEDNFYQVWTDAKYFTWRELGEILKKAVPPPPNFPEIKAHDEAGAVYAP